MYFLIHLSNNFASDRKNTIDPISVFFEEGSLQLLQHPIKTPNVVSGYISECYLPVNMLGFIRSENRVLAADNYFLF
jgi:hypothetical protein